MKKIIAAFIIGNLFMFLLLSLIFIANRNISFKDINREANNSANQIISDKEIGKESESVDDVVKIYKEFLYGKRQIKGGSDINSLTIPTGETDKHYNTKYAFFDSNGDGIPELHINSSRYYEIYTVRNNELTIWKDLSPYPYYYPLNNGAFISWKPGAAPMYDLYTYHVYNFIGDEIWNISFSCYDLNQNNIYDEKDEYYFEGVEVTKKQWIELTEKYLFFDTEGVIRIRNEIGWNTLYDGE